MILTDEHFEKNAHIPTEEVKRDLENAERELKGYEDERAAIMQNYNPLRDKLRVYRLDHDISKGREFINELGQILEHRKRSLTPIKH
jgi:flagellar biosynthesis chaperone FliJ